MATSAAFKQTNGRGVNFRSSSDSTSGSVGVDVRHTPESGYVVVVVLLMILVCLFLPLMAMLYFDTLKAQKQIERTEVRIEKLLKDFEKKEKQ